MNACQPAMSLQGSALRRLALLFGAMLGAVALLGAGASSASAEPVGIYLAGEESEEEASQPIFEAEEYPLFIEGQGQSLHRFTFDSGTWECPMSFLKDYGGEDEKVTEATRSLVFQPTPSVFDCSGEPEFHWSVYRHGCLFVLDALNFGPPYAGQLAIDCPTEQGFEIWAHLSGGFIMCKIEILPQIGLQGIDLENTGTGSESVIEADIQISGLKYTQSGFCGAGEFENGTYTGESELFGDDGS